MASILNYLSKFHPTEQAKTAQPAQTATPTQTAKQAQNTASFDKRSPFKSEVLNKRYKQAVIKLHDANVPDYFTVAHEATKLYGEAAIGAQDAGSPNALKIGENFYNEYLNKKITESSLAGKSHDELMSMAVNNGYITPDSEQGRINSWASILEKQLAANRGYKGDYLGEYVNVYRNADKYFNSYNLRGLSEMTLPEQHAWNKLFADTEGMEAEDEATLYKQYGAEQLNYLQNASDYIKNGGWAAYKKQQVDDKQKADWAEVWKLRPQEIPQYLDFYNNINQYAQQIDELGVASLENDVHRRAWEQLLAYDEEMRDHGIKVWNGRADSYFLGKLGEQFAERIRQAENYQGNGYDDILDFDKRNTIEGAKAWVEDEPNNEEAKRNLYFLEWKEKEKEYPVSEEVLTANRQLTSENRQAMNELAKKLAEKKLDVNAALSYINKLPDWVNVMDGGENERPIPWELESFWDMAEAHFGGDIYSATPEELAAYTQQLASEVQALGADRPAGMYNPNIQDDFYKFINNVGDVQGALAIANSGDLSKQTENYNRLSSIYGADTLRVENLDKWSAYALMDEYQVARFNDMYEESPEAAREYIDKYLSYGLHDQQAENKKQAAYEYASSGLGGAVAQTAIGIIGTPTRIAGYVENLANRIGNYVTGEYTPDDWNSPGNQIGHMIDAGYQGVMDSYDWNINIGGKDYDAFDFIFSTGTSAASSAMSAMFGPVMGAILLSGSAAQSAAYDIHERGGSDAQATVGGAFAGLFEFAFEKWSIGNFWKDAKALSKADFTKNLKEVGQEYLKTIGKETVINFSEEFFTEAANVVYDTLFNGDISNAALRIEFYESLGLPPEEARARVATELGMEIVEAGLSGAFMGAGFGTAAATGSAIGTHKASKQAGTDIISMGNQATLKDIAMGFGEGSEAAKMAQDYNPETATPKQTGDLYRAVVNELPAQMKETITETFALDAMNRLEKMGEMANVGEVALGVMKVVSGQELSQGEYMAVAGSEHGLELIKELTGANAVQQAQEAQEAQEQTQQPTAQEENDIEHIPEVPEQGIETGEDGEVTVPTDDGNRVALDEANLKADETAIIQEMAQLGDASIKAATEAWNAEANTEEATKLDAQEFARGFKRFYEAAMAGSDISALSSIYAGKLSQKARQAAITAAQASIAETQAKYEKTNAQRAKADGFRTAQEAGEEAGVSYAQVSKKISQMAKRQLQLIDTFAKDMGLRVQVYDTLNGGKANGKLQKGTNLISLALDAEGGLLTRTVSHESYHFIENWNAEAAQKLQTFVVEALKGKEGYNLDNEIQAKIEEYSRNGVELTKQEATREIVADSVLDVIGTEENIQKLLKQDQSLTAKISEVLKNIVAKMKAAMQKIGWNSAEVRALQGDLDYYESIQQMMQDALTGAKANYAQAQYKASELARQDNAVAEYITDMKNATNPEASQAALNGMVSNLFMRAEKGWLANHPDADLNESLQKFAGALKTYKRGEMALENALKRAGFDAQPFEMNTALSYAGTQLLQAEEKGQGGDVQYQIKQYTKNGRTYSYVKADRQVIHGDDPKAWAVQITDYINKEIRHGKDVTVYTENGVPLTITKDTAGKAAFWNTDRSRIPVPQEEYALKLRIEAHIDEAARVSVGKGPKAIDTKTHSFAREGWNYRKAYFEDFDGKYYSFQISVGKDGKLNTIYNVNAIKEEADTPNALKGARPQNAKVGATSSDGDRIAENPDSVKENIQTPAEALQLDELGIEGDVRDQFSLKSVCEAAGFEIVTEDDQPIKVLRNGKEVTRVTINDVRHTPIGRMIEMGIVRQRAVNPNVDYDQLRHDQLKMVADLMTMIVENKDAALIWDVAGSMMFSAIKTNADSQYGTTVDFGTICAKTQSLINSVSATMLKLGRGITPEEVQVVYEETANAGATVPCPPCYVYSRWIGVPRLLEEMRQNQLKYSSMSDAELNAYMAANPSTKDVKWIQQVLMKKGANGKWQKRADYKPVPNEILLDLNRGADFASQYPLSWKFRTTRGAALGKAIMPYSDARLGEITQGISNSAKNKGIKKGAVNPFLNDNEALAQKLFNNAVRKAKAQNLIGGQRYQSTSDFRPDWGSDYLMTFFEMQAVGANVQLYTKVIEAVDFLASSNAECNLSLISEGDGMVTLEDGTKALTFSSVAGIDYEAAYEKTQKYDNVQMILVGVNDEVIRMALAGAPVAVKGKNGKYRKLDHDSGISFVIPYHGSGSTVAALQIRMAAIGETAEVGNDYSNVQGDKVSPNQTAEQKAMWELRTNMLMGKTAQLTEAQKALLNKNKYLKALYKKLTDKASEWYGVRLNSKQAGQIFPHEYWDTSLTVEQADKNGERFKEYCASLGIIPRFSGATKNGEEYGNFLNDKGYWKLLIDRPMYNNDGTYHKPKAIDVTGISIDTIPQAVNTNYGYGDEYTERIANASMKRLNGEQFSLKKTDIAKSVEEDAALFTQVKSDEDIAAALGLVHRLHYTLRRGDSYTQVGANIPPQEEGAWEKRYDSVADKLLTETGSKYGRIKLKRKLKALYTAMDSHGTDTGEMMVYARGIAVGLLEEAPGVVNEMDEGTKEILQALKTSPFYLTDDMKSEIRATQGSVADYMRKNFGKMKIRAKGGAKSSLADVWYETLNPLRPDVFTLDATEADMPIILDAFLETANEKTYSSFFEGNFDQYATDIGLSILLEYYDLPGLANKSQALRDELLAKQQEIRTNYKQKYAERIRNNRERRQNTEDRQQMRKKIIRMVRSMNSKLLTDSDNKHVPQELKGAVSAMIRPFLDETGVFTRPELNQILQQYSMLAEGGKNQDIEAAYAYDEEIRDKIEAVAKTMDGRRLSQLTLEELTDLRDIVGNLNKIIFEQNEMQVNGRKMKREELGTRAINEQKKKSTLGTKGEKLMNTLYINTTPIYFFKRLGGVFTELWDDVRNGQTRYIFNVRAAKKYITEQIKKYNVNQWYQQKQPLKFRTQEGEDIELTKGQAMYLYATWKREMTNKLQDAAHLRIGGFVYAKTEANGKLKIDTAHPHTLGQADMDRIMGYIGKQAMEFVDETVRYLSEDMAALGNETSMERYGYEKFGEGYYFPYKVSSDYTETNLTKDQNETPSSLFSWGASKKTTSKANKPVVLGDYMDTWANHVNEMCVYNGFATAVDNLNRVYNFVTPSIVTRDADGNIISKQKTESLRAEVARAHGSGAAKYIADITKAIAGGQIGRSEDTAILQKMVSKFRKNAVVLSASVAVQQPSAIVRAMAHINPKFMGAPKPRKSYAELIQYSGTANVKEMGKFDVGMGQSAKQWMLDDLNSESKLKDAAGKIDNAMGKAPELMDQLAWASLWETVKREQRAKNPMMDPSSEAFLKLCGQRFDEVVDLTQVYDSVLSRSKIMRSNDGLAQMVTSFMAEPTLTTNMLMDAILNFKENKSTRNHLTVKRAAAVYMTSVFVNALLKSLVTAARDDDEEETYVEKYLAEFTENFTDDLSPLGNIPIAQDIISIFDGYDVERADMALISDLADAWEIVKAEDKSVQDKMLAAGKAVGALFGIPVKNAIREVETIFNLANSKPISETSKVNIKYGILEALPFTGLEDGKTTPYYKRMITAMQSGDTETYDELKGYVTGAMGKEEKTMLSGMKYVLKDDVLAGKITSEEAQEYLKEYWGMDSDDAYFQVDEWLETEANKDDDEFKYSRYGNVYEAVKAGKSITEASKELIKQGYTEKDIQSEIKSKIGEWYKAGEMDKTKAEKALAQYTDEDANGIYWQMRRWTYVKENGSDKGYSIYNDFYAAVETGANLKKAIQEMTSHGYTNQQLASQITRNYKDQYISLMKTNKTAAANLKARLLTAYAALGYDRNDKAKDIDAWLK